MPPSELEVLHAHVAQLFERIYKLEQQAISYHNEMRRVLKDDIVPRLDRLENELEVEAP